MRSIVISSICISSILLVLTIQSEVNRKACYEQELEEALSLSVSQTLKEVMEQESYGIEDRNQFIAAFLQALIVRTNSDADMTVSVISADMEKGMLDIEVKVVQEEKNALLSKGIRQKGNEIVVRRTVIFNRASG
ncbi:MAG: hypothetical protein HFG32_00880 [Eubacterium sp.]|jgi:hypothetical protein|nr:hypothetical protein [Eubacterium sp.]